MDIRLYKNFSKRKNSTKQPSSTPVTRSVVLKRETSIQKPVFTLTGFNNEFNYLYVPVWGRYYFIDDVVIGNNELFEIHCSCDYLASFKSAISSYTCFVERCADSHIDPYMRDPAVSSNSRIVSTESATTSAFPSATVYILRVLGRGSTNGIGTFCVTYNDIKNIFSGVWGDVDGDSVTDYIKALLNLYINDPSQYIVGVYRSPIGMSNYLSHGTDEQTIYVGGHETNLKGIRVDSPNAIIFNPVLNKPANMYNDFRATDPAFSSYTMYIPTIGTVQLPAEIMQMKLQIICCADLFSGDLTFMLYADDDLVATYTSNCYASVSVGVQNGSSGSNLVASALTMGMSVGTGNIMYSVPALVSGVQHVISPPASVIGTQGSLGAIETFPDIVITCEQKSSGDIPLGVYGRPCCKNLQLGSMTGYVKCANASIDIPAHGGDKDVVNNLLNSGFYYE